MRYKGKTKDVFGVKVPEHLSVNINHIRDADNIIVKTVALLRDTRPDGWVEYRGEAKVHPRDNPCKRTGRVMALGKDVSQYFKDYSIGG